MRRLVLALALALAVPAAAHATQDPKPDAEPRIQVAILLDTSSSMDGLIAQAKSQLWKIVNELARAKKNGRSPRLEVALYEYGKSSLPAEGGYIRRIVPLTTDLDKVSEELFALRTNGGDEYAGRAIHQATNELQWSSDKGALKMIFVAGNESFAQGPVKYQEAIAGALKRGITVSTIHCGSEQEGVGGKWAHAALVGEGRYSFIDHNVAVAAVAAPQDAELARLGAELNDTYLAYGKKGAKAKERQAVQDANAEKAAPGAAVARAAAKASVHYKNDDWDLVDAKAAGKDVKKLEEAELPAELRGLAPEAREKVVAEKAKKRDELRAKIRKLEAERRTFVAAEEAKRPADAPATFDEAMIDSVRAQGAAASFAFE